MNALPDPSPPVSGLVPEVRRKLLEAAARLLSEEGPSALSARRLAREASTSTMAVYTQFGGMPALVREVVAEGFARLRERLATVEHTDDALADLVQLCRAYRENALEHPNLYTVMFGGTSLGGYRLSRADMDVGTDTFTALADALDRVMGAGLIRRENSRHVAGQCWSALHGYIMLEIAGIYRAEDGTTELVLDPLLSRLLAVPITMGP
ncbi:TetR/AcrR family transcriptional regulator [Paeniglutamicibacter psychrophenolicus]|uniref:TetR/AcrR family transcriptional regulator n=1 Tax=Paeniglutamicibacter psychrophenolicus TaxID=257454 RepID=UPI00277FF036|nr:TetR/AcrR family transcriptional regulator [Paeniglutamicibacter psychrophenolicus]MDQ0095296.1 AcrR family transcriptional regulator [Paeniglutamicibacter psychrophenolicus]